MGKCTDIVGQLQPCRAISGYCPSLPALVADGLAAPHSDLQRLGPIGHLNQLVLDPATGMWQQRLEVAPRSIADVLAECPDSTKFVSVAGCVEQLQLPYMDAAPVVITINDTIAVFSACNGCRYDYRAWVVCQRLQAC